MTRQGLLRTLTDYWQGLVALGAILAMVLTFWVRGALVVAMPARLDSLAVVVRAHVDSTTHYGRQQVQLQRQILCVLVAQTTPQKERCVMAVLGEQP